MGRGAVLNAVSITVRAVPCSGNTACDVQTLRLALYPAEDAKKHEKVKSKGTALFINVFDPPKLTVVTLSLVLMRN